jgi:hypothetical protein
MALLIGHTENFDHSMLYQCRSYHSLHALIFAIDATAVGRLSTITRVVSKSCRKEGKLLVGCMVVTLAKQLQRIHVP